MGVIEDYGSTLLLLAIIFGFFMAWGVGANDVANAMGTLGGFKGDHHQASRYYRDGVRVCRCLSCRR